MTAKLARGNTAMARFRHPQPAAALLAALLAVGCRGSGASGDGEPPPPPDQCAAPLTACGTECVDLATSASHCGACGTACEAWESCTAATCVAPPCAEGRIRCGPTCVDPLSDAANCGACGRACGTTCTLGTCAGSPCTIFGLPGPPAAFAGANPVALVADDLDGLPGADVAVVNGAAPGAGDVRVLVGVGDGALAPAAAVAIPPLAGTIAAGEVNGDLHRDLAVSIHAASDGIRLFLGGGDGTFSAMPAASAGEVGAYPQAVALVDLDGDGAADLVVGTHPDGASGTDPNVRVLLNDGTGLFGSGTGAAPRPANLALQVGGGAGASPSAFAFADFDGNGAIDVAVAHASGLAVIYRAAGDVLEIVEVSTPRPPAGIVAVDVDGDGAIDLAAADPGGDGIYVAFKIGPAGRTFEPVTEIPTSVGPVAIVAANLDGDPDHRPDLATADAAGTVTIIRNTLVPVLGVQLVPFSVPAGVAPVALAAADMNADGLTDLVAADATGNAIVLLADGAGGFLAPDAYPAAGDAQALALFDANGDGTLDLAVADRTADQVAVRLGNGDGTFGAASSVDFAPPAEPAAVAAGDLDGDGNADLAVALQAAGKLAVLWGDGAAGFSPPVLLPAAGLLDGLDDVAVADLGDPDGLALVAAASGSGDVVVFRPSGVRSFAAPDAVHVGDAPAAVAVGAVDGDGRDDVVVALPGAGAVAVLLRDPASPGRFLPPVRYAAAPGVAALALADLDGDGHLDVAAAAPATGAIAVLLNDGTGGLGAGATFPACAGVSSVAARDLTGDGIRDLVVACPGRGATAILRGLGGGAFGPALLYAAAGTPVRVAVGDLDGADAADVASANLRPPGSVGGIAVQRGRCLP